MALSREALRATFIEWSVHRLVIRGDAFVFTPHCNPKAVYGIIYSVNDEDEDIRGKDNATE